MKKASRNLPHTATRIILDSISDGVFTVDYNWQITSFNKAAELITGISEDEALGRYCWDVFRSNMCEGECALKKTMDEGRPNTSSTTYIINAQGEKVPIAVSTSLLIDEKDNVLGGVETFRDVSVVEELRKEIEGRYSFGEMVSRNHKMQEIFSILRQVAESDSTVLIEGETGTGKEVLARTIHQESKRAGSVFMAVNCGALPDQLLESELFGYKKGAFTGADKDKTGIFADAENGTVFLDEIGETSSAFQVRLLRVLQEKEFTPLGSTKPIKCNVRILAATNRKLSEMIDEGTFRKDLYYRINIVRFTLPPLRERKEDITILLNRFVDKLNGLQNKSIIGFSEKAVQRIFQHDFPGNIRELENIVEHSFIMCGQGEIDEHHLPEHIGKHPGQKNSEDNSFNDSLHESEEKIILDALRENNFNRLATAKSLGIHKTTLFRKIKKLHISLPDLDGRSSILKGSSG